MKRIYFLVLLSIVSLSAFTQHVSGLDKSVKKMMKQAESNIPDFHRKSVTVLYPIYNVFTKKECHKMTFTQVPTYSQFEKYLDFDHIKLDHIFAKTPEGIWDLASIYDSYNSFYHSKSANSRIFDYLDSIKPDRVYKPFGRSYLILIEKNGHRYLIKEINKHYQPCELIDFIPDIAYFNTWYFPNETKKSASNAN